MRLEVADSSDRAPVPRCADDDATGGRGLALVVGLADRWGWSREEGGKRIWCELDRGGQTGPAPGRAGGTGCGPTPGGGASARDGLAFEAV